MREGVVRLLALAAVRVFYRVDRAGSPPPSGSIVLLPNHPNALLDPALVWATAGRDVRFLAKSTLFTGVFGPLVRAAGAIPVFRKQDEGGDASRNAEMFAAVDEALRRGDAICVFPEGISHSSGRLEPLRTGAARMAMSAAARGTAVQIVPVGINPDRKTVFLSRMTVVYGRPFSVTAGASVQALTEEVAVRMRQLIVEADPEADGDLVIRIDQLYASERGTGADAQSVVERRRTIAAGLNRLRQDRPEWYAASLLQLRRYDQRLRRFGLGDSALDWNTSLADAVHFTARELPIAIVLVPVAAVALVVFAVPYGLTAASARLQKETDVTATAKVLGGAALYAAWIAALAVMAGRFFGGPAGWLTAAVLPVLAAAGLFAIEREASALRTARSWLALRGAHANTRTRLRRHRAELADVLDEVNDYLRER
ncbi:MAG TPA: 1-acyl-sn-glycerol-3-phosphate acyltransferase [Vicinamibacterales bacterium]|nr:1-acyl-sn-glycerol-3-phosphate acyltransferase [Vicinamibacterales bacterium]